MRERRRGTCRVDVLFEEAEPVDEVRRIQQKETIGTHQNTNDNVDFNVYAHSASQHHA